MVTAPIVLPIMVTGMAAGIMVMAISMVASVAAMVELQEGHIGTEKGSPFCNKGDM